MTSDTPIPDVIGYAVIQVWLPRLITGVASGTMPPPTPSVVTFTLHEWKTPSTVPAYCTINGAFGASPVKLYVANSASDCVVATTVEPLRSVTVVFGRSVVMMTWSPTSRRHAAVPDSTPVTCWAENSDVPLDVVCAARSVSAPALTAV